MASLNKERIFNPVVLITGASSGFGLLTALRYAEQGYLVIATMRNLDRRNKLEEMALQRQLDSNIVYWQLDVTKEQDIQEVMTRLHAEYGRLDVLVNNAGYAVGGMTEEVPFEEWQKQMDTNFYGVLRMTQAVLPLMREQLSGYIINIGSVSGRLGIPGYAPYCASKFAIEGLSESLRLELSPFGIKVVLIEPGAYRTSIWDKGFEQIHSKPSSPYRQLLESVLSYSRRTAADAPDPDQIAHKIVKVSQIHAPTLRYTMGKGARITLWSKAILPWKWFERLLLMMLNK